MWLHPSILWEDWEGGDFKSFNTFVSTGLHYTKTQGRDDIGCVWWDLRVVKRWKKNGYFTCKGGSTLYTSFPGFDYPFPLPHSTASAGFPATRTPPPRGEFWAHSLTYFSFTIILTHKKRHLVKFVCSVSLWPGRIWDGPLHRTSLWGTYWWHESFKNETHHVMCHIL